MDINSAELIELVLVPVLIGLPIESVQCLRDKVVVRVIPQLVNGGILIQSQSPRMTYILNPSGDCPGTEKSILPLLDDWTRGYYGRVVSDSEFIETVGKSDLFLFSGHGGGEKYWSGTSIQRMRCASCSGISLLMGCSSAKPYGDYASPFCTPFHYLIGGCRLVVGTLWDVLGRELDRITVDIVNKISQDTMRVFDMVEMAKIFSHSRSKAKLGYLSSASIVMYVTDDWSTASLDGGAYNSS
jgi:separase